MSDGIRKATEAASHILPFRQCSETALVAVKTDTYSSSPMRMTWFSFVKPYFS